MRVVRMIFLTVLAIALVILALANRQMVVLRPFPANLDAYLGGSWQLTMPLFLVIFLALLVGMVLGLIWEWLREAQLRAESSRRARDLAQLEAAAGTRSRPRDDVLALLDAAPPVQTNAAPGLPARR